MVACVQSCVARPEWLLGTGLGRREETMAQIDLTEREHRALRKALESYLRELRGEITHTDAREVRDDLKDEEEALKGVLARLADTRKASR
jgi:hypothetical protein